MTATLDGLIRRWEARGDWAAGDDCPRDYYPQDAFQECIDQLRAAKAGSAEALEDHAAAAALRDVLKTVKRRLHYVGMPNEPMWEGRPDWRKEIALIEDALADQWCLNPSPR